MADHYAVLGLPPGVPMSQVKARFRQLAMVIHPDRNAADLDCQERLRVLNAAYEFLSDPSRKADYDALHRVRVDSASGRVFADSAPVPAAYPPRSAYFLSLAVLCAFLVGLIVAVTVLVGSAQSAGSAAPQAAVTVIDLPATDDRDVFPPRTDEPALSVVPPLGDPVSAAPSPPGGDKTLWPGDTARPLAPVTSTASGVSPVAFPPPPGSAP